MARKRTIEYTAFDVEILDENVTTESYIELFKYIKKKEKDVRIWGVKNFCVELMNLQRKVMTA